MDPLNLVNQTAINTFCKTNAIQSFLENEETYLNLKKLISSVFLNRDAWPFREAVKESEAPNYYEIIKNPMDLSIIKQKLNDKIYKNFQQLENDFRLIVNNSEKFNGPYNGFTTNAYAVWRLFRKLTKKYLNLDLSLEDKDAFIFPPRYNFANKTFSSIAGKRKKRKKQSKSSKLQALELLYNATQDSIESTFQKFAFSPMSDNENREQSNVDNLPKKYPFLKDNLNENTKLTGFYNESFANLNNYSNLDGYYNEFNRNENLVFKSLKECDLTLEDKGIKIVLPEKSVFVNNSPVDSRWLTNFPNDQPNYKAVFNSHMFTQPINGQLQDGKLFGKEQCSRIKKSKEKNGDHSVNQALNEKKMLLNDPVKKENIPNGSTNSDENQIFKPNLKKRLVIKLSKLNNDWKPILNCDKQSSQESGSESDSSFDSSSSCSFDCEK